MNESIDSGYSFTPKQKKHGSNVKFLVSEEVKKIISFNMTPFKDQQDLCQIPTTPITQGHDRKLQDVMHQLELESLNSDALDFLLRNTQTNTLCSIHLNTVQRSILFQALPLLIDGLVVVVSYNYVLLKEKLRRIQDLVSWAAINPEVPQHQIEYILENISSKNIRLLILHPEHIFELQNLQVQLLLLDQANYYLPFLEIGKITTDLTNIITQANVKYIHILMPTVQAVILQDLVQSQPFGRSYLYYRDQYHIQRQITATRDENPLKSLISLLRSQHLFRKSGILVYCSNNQQVEQVQFKLQQSGFKSNSINLKKNEAQRQASYYDLASQIIDILVLPSGFQLPEGLKNFIYLTVHLHLPLNIETYLLDIDELNQEANSHIFLCDESYFQQRAELATNFIQINSLVDFFTESLYTSDLIKQDENDITYWLTKKWLHSTNQEYQESKIKQILMYENSQTHDLLRGQIFHFLQELEKQKWLEIQVSIPIEILISNANEDEQFIQNLQIYGKKTGSLNGTKCLVEDLIRDTNYTTLTMINRLKQLKIKYEILEEAQIIKLIHFPSSSELQAKILEIYTQMKRQNIIRINNLDQTYLMAKSGSYRSLDYMWKQIQLQKDQVSTYIQDYLSSLQYIDATNNQALPFIKLDTQREKSTLLLDVKSILEQESNMTWIQKESYATKALTILQGLKKSKKEFKSLSQWNKYHQYNYLKIHEMIHEMLNEKIQNQQCRKKIKF